MPQILWVTFFKQEIKFFESKIAVLFVLCLANKIIANLLFSGMAADGEGSTMLATMHDCTGLTAHCHIQQGISLPLHSHQISLYTLQSACHNKIFNVTTLEA